MTWLTAAQDGWKWDLMERDLVTHHPEKKKIQNKKEFGETHS